MKWDYDSFYHHYTNYLQQNKNKDLKLCITELKKVSIRRKQEIEVFYHKPQEVDVAKLVSTECAESHLEVYPMGLYVAQLQKEKINQKKRFYIIFPSYKTVNQMSNEKQIIADHFTFLIENTSPKDKKPVKSHITLYFPTGVVFDRYNTIGTKQRFDFYLPREFECNQLNIEKYVKISDQRYKDCIQELLGKPLIDIQNAGGLPLRKMKSTHERQFTCKNLKLLMNKYFITETTIIGINNDYTAFVTATIPDTNDNSTGSDNDDELPEVSSFTFKLQNNTYNELEKKLITIMRTWENKFLHQ